MISIIIITYKRPDLLKKCLYALSKQTLAKESIETLVIYDPSDPYAETIKDMTETFGFESKACTEKGVAKNRNFGAKIAKGEILGFIDDDAVPCPEWAKAMLNVFTNQCVGAAGGRIIAGDADGGVGKKYSFSLDNLNYINSEKKVGSILFNEKLQSLRYSSRYDETCEVGEIDTPMGCNMAVRAEIFRRLGGFKSMPREETELAIRIQRAGWKVYFAPKALVYHSWAESGGVRSLKGLFLSINYKATAFIYKNYFWDGTSVSLLKFIFFTPLPSLNIIKEAGGKGMPQLVLRILASTRGFISLIIGLSQ